MTALEWGRVAGWLVLAAAILAIGGWLNDAATKQLTFAVIRVRWYMIPLLLFCLACEMAMLLLPVLVHP